MKVKPFQFKGTCRGCGRCAKRSRGAVDVTLNSEGLGEWLCLPCAKTLVSKLKKAIRICEEKIAAGQEYRHDRWQRPRDAVS